MYLPKESEHVPVRGRRLLQQNQSRQKKPKIVLHPVLFFPSTILCALSGILITEAARATAANNQAHLQRLTKAVIQKTLQLSIFIAAGLLLYGNLIGTLLDGGALAGHLIRLLAPVVPFIYLEIVLEALLKGMGQQSFSSHNF